MAAIIATAAMALLAAGCGGSPSAADSGGASNAGGPASSQAANSQMLAFSRCIRTHGVPNFPDPNSSGELPKSQVILVAANNPEYQAAVHTCGHLVPNGGPGVPPSPAMVQLIQTDMLKFARCMRSHGVPDWPDPTLDRGRAIFNPQTAGIDPNSPQISTTIDECQHVFPASLGIPPGA